MKKKPMYKNKLLVRTTFKKNKTTYKSVSLEGKCTETSGGSRHLHNIVDKNFTAKNGTICLCQDYNCIIQTCLIMKDLKKVDNIITKPSLELKGQKT